MLVYDKAYMDFRNKYVVPLATYSVAYKSLRYVNVKQAIRRKSLSIETATDKGFVFHFNQEDLYKAILGEIELFYIRKHIHQRDSVFCAGDGISANWNIVTNYYNAFFSASLMLRLCHRGNMYLENELKKEIEILISDNIGEPVRLDSKLVYEICEQMGQPALKIKETKYATHELVWIKMNELVDEMLKQSRENSEEYLVLLGIKQISSRLGVTFPSQLRNRVNYQPLYGLEYLDKKIFQLNKKVSWVEYLLNYSDTDDENQVACYMYAYNKYIENFCYNFIAEYYELKGNENGILKKINTSLNERNSMCGKKFVF